MAMVERLTIIRGVEKFELQTKTARWVLAKEEGYSPVQMLVSAIGACGDTCINPFWKIRTFPLSLKNRSHVFKRSRETSTTIKTGDDSLYVTVPEAFQERATRCLKLVSPNCPVIQSLAERITVEETVVFKK